jgi:hypothetical protein
MFRVNVRTQVVAGALHYHVRLSSFRGDGCWYVCGILMLHEAEWLEFLRICQAFHIEVIVGEVPATASEASSR